MHILYIFVIILIFYYLYTNHRYFLQSGYVNRPFVTSAIPIINNLRVPYFYN